MSSIGDVLWRSHSTNATSVTAAITKAAITWSDDQPFSGPSMIPNSSVASPTIDSTAPTGSSRDCLGSRDLGMMNAPSHEGDPGHRNVDPEHRVPREVLEQEAADHRADGDGEPGEAGPDRDRPAALLGIVEDVGEDRQRRGHDQRPADAHEGAGEDQLLGGVGQSPRRSIRGRTARGRAGGRPCDRTGRRGCRRSTAGRRTPARSRR